MLDDAFVLPIILFVSKGPAMEGEAGSTKLEAEMRL